MILDAHCRAIGRDPGEIQRGANALLVLSDDPAVVQQMRGSGRPVIAGSAAEVRGVIQEYIDAGVDEVVIPDFNLGADAGKKIEVMDRFATGVMSHFR